MVNNPTVKLPEAFTAYIEQNYYAQVTKQSELEVIVQDPEFLKNPLKHVALFSDHGILHGRDIASKIIQVIQHIQGLLIPARTPNRLEFMLGYGAMLAYLHDIGMKNFSAFGRAMHPEFAAQLIFTAEFDPWIDLLWGENSDNIAWRLMNLSVQGTLEQSPQLVFREMLALSMAHSKSKVPIDLLNDVHLLRQTMQQCISTELNYLYHQQQVAIAKQKLEQRQDSIEYAQRLETAQTQFMQFSATTIQRLNLEINRYYDRFEQTAFSWLIADQPDLQQLTLDVIDTVRALRCADALRQRGTAFTTSAGYEVFVSEETANAVYTLKSRDRAQVFFVEGKDPISAGEANIANSSLDQAGNLRIALTRGAFSSREATQWAAFSAAVVIQDIQSDVIGSFRRLSQEHLQGVVKLEPEMQILIEGVDDNPDFALLVCQELSQLNPDFSARIQAVTSLQNTDLNQLDRYLSSIQPDWNLSEKLYLLDQLVKSGHKVDHIDLDRAFTETRLITVKAGEVLIARATRSGFVYIPLSAGLMCSINHQMRPVLPWVQIGDVEVIRNTIAPYKVVAEQTVELLMIPKQIYRRYWYASYSVNEFTQLFDQGNSQPELPTKRTTSLQLDLQRLIRRRRTLPIAVHLMELFPASDQLEMFIKYLEEMELSQGEVLFSPGDHPKALYFIELGQIIISKNCKEQTQIIQTFDSGGLVGEWEFYCRANYRYSAVASKATTLYCLPMDAMQKMREESPQIANIFAQYLLESFAHQLSEAKQKITMLQQERSETVECLTAL